MPCFRPLQGFRGRIRNRSGKASVVFSAKDGFADMPVEVACGQCIGCKLERSRQWAVRCMHESSLYERNCFITLTLDDSKLPVDMSLDKTVFPKFMKRLRKRFGSGVRYFMCGEYGELLGRPHYHACLFNFDFEDRKLYPTSSEHRIYTSKTLDEIWSFGKCWIGNVTFESAAYCARYCLKKITGEEIDRNSDDFFTHYTYIDERTGEFYERVPEFATMSRNPGIGAKWFDKFGVGSVYPDNFVVVRGKKCVPPKYYRSRYEMLHPDVLGPLGFPRKSKQIQKLVLQGKALALRNAADNTSERLKVRETVVSAKVKTFKREVE